MTAAAASAPPRIRYAKAADHAEIAAIIEPAFTAQFGSSTEADLVARLRADGDVIFELVADTDGRIDGHILFSRLWADRAELFAALAPMCVRPGLQRSGIGSALVTTALECAREFGVHGVLVLGHPDYYPRFGFSKAAAAFVQSPYSQNPAFMALELEPGALSKPLHVVYADAFG